LRNYAAIHSAHLLDWIADEPAIYRVETVK